jgi:hypothetical protein
VLVEELLNRLRARFSVAVEEIRVTHEDVVFRLPGALVD